MRIRITKPQSGSLDGVPLAGFVVGQTYEVPATLASYLVTLGTAEPIMDNSQAASGEGRGPGANILVLPPSDTSGT